MQTFFEYHGRHRSRPRLSNHDKITLCSAGSKGAEKGATVVEWIYTGDGVHIRAAPDGRKLFHVARCMSAGMIHRIGVRGCWRWSVAVRMTAFHQFGAKGTKRMPLSVPPHTSSYTCPNPAPTALPLLSPFPLEYAHNLSILSTRYLAVCYLCEHCHNSSPEPFHDHTSPFPSHRFQDGSIVSTSGHCWIN